MVNEVFLDNLGFVSNILSLIFIPVSTIILGYKLVKERKSTGEYNIVRLIVFSTFLTFSLNEIIGFIVDFIPSWEKMWGATFGISNFFIGLMVTFGLTLICYINRWEALYYSAIFFYSGMTIFYLLTGYDEGLAYFTNIAGAIDILFLYFTGLRVKDNGALGLAVFFSLAFSTLFIEDPLTARIIIFGYIAFIVYFSLGFFKPLKQEAS
ncbi:MAG: hypothetical protein ACFE8L_11305 [Candidatus Hodarchaeota archaeon]